MEIKSAVVAGVLAVAIGSAKARVGSFYAMKLLRAILKSGTRIATGFFFGLVSTSILASPPTLYGTASDYIFQIDPTTGSMSSFASTVIGGSGVTIGALAYAPNGTLYGTASDYIFQIDPTTGSMSSFASTVIGGSGVTIGALAYAPNGTLYGTANAYIFQIDPANGAISNLASTVIGGSGVTIGALAYAPDGTLYGTYGSIFQVDPTNGAISNIASTVIGGSGVNIGALAYVSSVPEPETYAMMLAGLGLLGVVARRRKLKS